MNKSFRTVLPAVLVFLLTSCGGAFEAPGEGLPGASATRSHWMTEMASDLRDVPLTKAVIPGSHDAGTYSITDDAPFSPDVPLDQLPELKKQLLENATLAPRANYYVARFARAQAGDITQQLYTGMRYFDLRPGASNNGAGTDLLAVHSLYGGDILKMIDQVKDFLNKNPKEIVFLDFGHFTAMNASHHAQLISHIKNAFGNKLVPRPPGAAAANPQANTYTFGNLWDKGWQVVCLYHNDMANDERALWRHGTPEPSDTKWWPDLPTTDGVKASLDNILQVERPKLAAGDLFVLQTVLTGDASLFAKAVVKMEAAAKVQATLDGVSSTIVGLQSTVNSAQKKVSHLQSKINSKQRDINDDWDWIHNHSCFWHAVECGIYRAEIEAFELEKKALKSAKSVADSALADARGDLKTANTKIATLEKQIDVLLAGPTSLAQMAAEGNPTMVGWLESWRGKGLNIIIQDVGDVGFVDEVMALNRKN